jgi:hypothetical protein
MGERHYGCVVGRVAFAHLGTRFPEGVDVLVCLKKSFPLFFGFSFCVFHFVFFILCFEKEKLDTFFAFHFHLTPIPNTDMLATVYALVYFDFENIENAYEGFYSDEKMAQTRKQQTMELIELEVASTQIYAIGLCITCNTGTAWELSQKTGQRIILHELDSKVADEILEERVRALQMKEDEQECIWLTDSDDEIQEMDIESEIDLL